MNMDINLLSAQAKEKYFKLQQQLQEVVSADRVREPKLTDAEKAEVSTLEASLEKTRPVSQRLRDLIRTKDERLKYLERNSQKIIIEGGDVDELATELALLRPALELLESAYNSTNSEINVAEHGIRRIKENARTREVRHEAAQ